MNETLYSISAMNNGSRKFIKGIDPASVLKIVSVLLEKETGQITLCKEIPEGESGRIFIGDRD